MSHDVLSLSKFYARRIQRRHVYALAKRCRHLRHAQSHRRMLTWIEEVLHATEALRYFRVTPYTSIPGCPPRLKSIKRPKEAYDASTWIKTAPFP